MKEPWIFYGILTFTRFMKSDSKYQGLAMTENFRIIITIESNVRLRRLHDQLPVMINCLST